MISQAKIEDLKSRSGQSNFVIVGALMECLTKAIKLAWEC